MGLVVLDADGVFMNEMPYWRTALAVAFDADDLRPGDIVGWGALARACLEEHRVQAVTKRRGCNSNWDMAAVMVHALEQPGMRADVGAALARRAFDNCAAVLEQAMEALWTGTVDGEPPLHGFGVDRHGPRFGEVVTRFQAVFFGTRNVGWSYPRHELAAPAERTRAACARLAMLGPSPAVCTSRKRDEIVPPMAELGILDAFDRTRIVTHDDVLEGQRRTGTKPLGKPHWFPLAAALCGFKVAAEAVRDPTRPLSYSQESTLVYIGDAPADYASAAACRARGLPVRYVHVDSGVTGEATLAAIENDADTLAVVAHLTDAVEAIAELRR